MIRILYSFVFLVGVVSNLWAQEEEILLTIDNHTVSKNEFEYIYNKNNNNLYNEADKKSVEEYLDLFINFKLKVVEAENLKLDTSQTFINELSTYRKELAIPYLTDVQFNDNLVHEMYRRMQLEVNASHILLQVDRNATPTRQQEVLDEIIAIRKEIIAGKDFAQAALEYSEDPSVQKNKGNLGYFSAFTMVAPFEEVAFNTPAGEVSEPVKTAYGYHLIKVHDIRKNKGEVLVAHILKNIPKNASPEEKNKAKTQIDSIYQELLQGADFAELAKKESQDRRSAVKGGELFWLAAGRTVPKFSDAAFGLKNIGDYTAPVETSFGYHIIKKIDERKVPPFEDAKTEIEKRIIKDPERNTSCKTVFTDKLKTEYNFSENAEGKKAIETFRISEKKDLPEAVLFTIDNHEYKTSDLKSYIQKNELKRGTYLLYYPQWVDYEITRLEDSKLEEKYPEFRYLINEYHDGILLFQISQDKIWQYAAEDSVGLEKFFEKNKKQHLWAKRFKGCIITAKSTEVREKAEELLGAGMTCAEVAEHLNTSDKVIEFKTGAWEEGSNPIVDYYVWNGNTPENFDSETTFIRGDKIAPEPKQLNDARGLYISLYQDYLEKKWIKELRDKYKIKINKKLLKTIESV